MNGVYQGRIKFFSVQKGYGFIACGQAAGGKDIFFHNVDCPKDGSPPLRECEEVTFTVIKEPKGLRAKNIQRASFVPKGLDDETDGNSKRI